MVTNVGMSSGAVNAYQNTAKILQDSGLVNGNSNGEASKSLSGGAFENLISAKFNETAALLNKSEQISQAAIAGKADMKDVVTAVASAEVALKTVVAVRDSVISAYQEIIRMQL